MYRRVQAGLKNQSHRASGLTLLTAAISRWNTVYIERAIGSLRRKGIPINEQLISHLPLISLDVFFRKASHSIGIVRHSTHGSKMRCIVFQP